MPEPAEPQLLTTGQLAQRLGVSPRWIEARVAEGAIPCHRLPPANRLVRFQLDEVIEWIRSANLPVPPEKQS